KETEKWIHYFNNENTISIAVNVNNQSDINQVVQTAKQLGQQKIKRLEKKGVRPRALRGMIVGIPNVGKSTLINRLANKKIAKTGDRPGITKQQSWIKVKNE